MEEDKATTAADRRAYYLAKAEDALKKLAEAPDAESRLSWQQVADNWRALAAQIERTARY